jgi:predicted MPP superfamily phosphohydrolase
MDFERSGNNDVNALEAALAARQIQTLHNRYIRLTHPELGIDLYLAGVDDVVEGSPELMSALSEIPYEAPTVLLSHNPDILAEPGIEQADLVLSGHTHGGQVVLPLLGAAHTQTRHLQRSEVSGYLRRGKTQVYITRGVGEGIPLRFGAAPQITLITLLPA